MLFSQFKAVSEESVTEFPQISTDEDFRNRMICHVMNPEWDASDLSAIWGEMSEIK